MNAITNELQVDHSVLHDVDNLCIQIIKNNEVEGKCDIILQKNNDRYFYNILILLLQQILLIRF